MEYGGMAEKSIVPLFIRPVRRDAQPGDFGATVSGTDLILPEDVARTFMAHDVRTAADLLSYIYTFPTAVAEELRWKPADLKRGLARLKGQLAGHVDDFFLNPPAIPARHYGASDPDDIHQSELNTSPANSTKLKV
jgi:hypothetical protein